MKLLLDTHAFLWWDSTDSHLPSRLSAAIADPDNEIYVSSVSAWEIAIKRASGKLAFDGSMVKAMAAHGFQSLPITVEHAEEAGSLPVLHRDPFDRLLVAQAQMEGMALVTVDAQILRYPVKHL
jgi:PIN domain nuclease of toxin-antitoxin system